MVDLAYAAVYFNDPDMADEVDGLEVDIDALVHQMRTLCIVAVRHPREAEAMSAVLQVVSALERIANDAVDIARIVTHASASRTNWWSTSARPRRSRTGSRWPVARTSPTARCPASNSRSSPACGSWPSDGPGMDHRSRRRRDPASR